jgi:glyoxylase-like metal-dependent hydrolase (beta-lactamase superfamily II)
VLHRIVPTILISGSVLALPSLAAAQGSAAPGPDPGMALTSYQRARVAVARGLETIGGAAAIERAQGVALDGEGELDLGTLLQGRRPSEGDPHPILERIAIVPKAHRLVHEERAPINPDALNWQRTDYRPDGTYRIDMEARRASWTRPASRRSVERLIPQLLLAEILADPASLRHLGGVTVGGEPREAIGWHVPERGQMTLFLDPRTHLLREIETIADLPVRGDSTIRWRFLEYTPVSGLGPFPTGYTIHVNGERLREIRWTRRTPSPAGGILDAPPGIELPPPTPFEPPPASGSGAGSAPTSASRPEYDIRDLAPGVYLVANVRTGFHMLFVEFADYVAAVDAPSGWWELQELPARNWAQSASPALGERYVAAIRSRVGDKPIRYVVLTHHHSDHAGGVRAFVEQGATVVAADLTRPVVERTLAGSLTLAGRAGDAVPALRFEPVEGARTIRNGEMEMRIIDVGSNPHSEGMLAVWLPGPKILYVSDLFDPWSTRGSPAPDRLPVMRWFVQWLDRSGLEPERIYAIHGSALVRPENLEEIRRGMAGGKAP